MITKLIKGQIPFPLVMSIATFVAAPIVGYFTAQASIDDKIQEVENRTAILETRIPYIEQKVTETNEDVKDLKRALNVK